MAEGGGRRRGRRGGRGMGWRLGPMEGLRRGGRGEGVQAAARLGRSRVGG